MKMDFQIYYTILVAKNVIYVCSGSKLHIKQKFNNVPLHILERVPLCKAAKNIGYERKLPKESVVALISYFVFIVR